MSNDTYLAALKMLARRELSEAQLRQRLTRREHDPEAIEAALTRLKADRSLDDERVAGAIARSETNLKKRGRYRVTRQIEAAGIAPSIARRVVDETFSAIDGDALLQESLARRLRGRTRIEDDREFNRLYRYLVAQGFEPDRVLTLLREKSRYVVSGFSHSYVVSGFSRTYNRDQMTSKEIRASFLAFFERHGHRIVPSSPLVPHEDPTLLFTNAGMNQFKDTLLGKEKRSYKRATTTQKCMRVSGKHNDLDNVGPSLRHHTFFEMLGNFSFGDYFKREAIPFAWTLLTDVWQIPKDRLTVTIFQGDASVPRDAEAYDIWKTLLPPERIGELGADDNFWTMGDTGPCGRCSEIYFFRGASVPCGEELAGRSCRGVECSCDRYVEIWNNVFMEFDRQTDGKLNPLPAPSIDTGMGLERVTAVLQGHLSNYDTDLFTPILSAIGARAGTTHRGTMEPSDVSMRVVADHLRAMTFLIADGVVPSNEWRGYVLRKIMRRAMRHGKRLGIQEPFLSLDGRHTGR